MSLRELSLAPEREELAGVVGASGGQIGGTILSSPTG